MQILGIRGAVSSIRSSGRESCKIDPGSRWRGVVLLTLFSIFRHALPVHAQPSSATVALVSSLAAPSASCCSEPTIACREVDFPYYTLLNGYQFTLLLVSDSPRPIDLSIAIYGALGHSAIAPPHTIQPQQKLALDMGQPLAKMGLNTSGEFGQGYVSPAYTHHLSL